MLLLPTESVPPHNSFIYGLVYHLNPFSMNLLEAVLLVLCGALSVRVGQPAFRQASGAVESRADCNASLVGISRHCAPLLHVSCCLRVLFFFAFLLTRDLSDCVM